MARRAVQARAVDLGLQGTFELLWGPHGDFRLQCVRCRDAERAEDPYFTGVPVLPGVVSAFRRNLEETRGTPLEGFHADDGTPCLSVYPSAEAREASWFGVERARMLDGAQPGARPWAWFFYEAATACRHRPLCDWRGRGREWLEEHGQLTLRERAALAREDAEAGEGEA